jgi:hypothetical protein
MKVSIGRPPKDTKKIRRMSVVIHDHDTWSLDSTLAAVIWPALEKYLEVSKKIIVMDVPDEEYGGLTLEQAVTELIWVFREISTGDEENRIISEHFIEDGGADVGWFRDPEVMHDRQNALAERLRSGLRLFAATYFHLWN